MTGAPGEGELISRPYSERQRIVVVDDAIVAAEREAIAEVASNGAGIDWGKVATNAAKIAAGGVIGGSVGTVVGLEVVAAAAKARSDVLRVLAVSRTEAKALRLPPGIRETVSSTLDIPLAARSTIPRPAFIG
jgi:hypothetical protein